MTYRFLLALAAAIGLAATMINAGETPAPDGARVYFVDLKDGDRVRSPVTVRFGLEGMGIAPAGVEHKNTGHHHLLLDRPTYGEGEDDDPAYSLPADEHHIHFGGGQTEVELALRRGRHTLQLLLGDANHIPHNPPVMSERITITVR